MRIALTFDDGPTVYTRPIVDLLNGAGVRATFFVLGRHIEEMGPEGEKLLIQMLQDGHEIGNHSWSHAFAINHTDDHTSEVLLAEFERMDERIRALRRRAGVPVDAPITSRLPWGPGNRHAAAVKAAGRWCVDWDVHIGDWDPLRMKDGVCLANDLRRVMHDPAIVLLHDGDGRADRRDTRQRTVDAVAEFLRQAAPEINARTWQFSPIGEVRGSIG